jgi:hypothetical protein
MRHFIDLKEIYKNEVLDSENYQIFYSSISEKEFEEMKKRNFSKPWYYDGIQPNFPYVTLYKKGQKVMMSDVPMEKSTNQNFINKANGDVLIFGLGLGLIILPLLQDEEISSITVVEIDEGLINLVKPILDKYDSHKKLKIIKEDAFNFHTKLINGEKFDSIYFDIWISITADNTEEMLKLGSIYHKFINEKNKNSFIDYWCFDYCRKLYLSTRDFIMLLKSECPDMDFKVSKEILYINGKQIENIRLNGEFFAMKHRYYLNDLILE